MIRKETLRMLRREGTLQLWALAVLALAGAVAIVVNSQLGAMGWNALNPQARLRAATVQQSVTLATDTIAMLQARIRRSPDDVQAYALLGGAYIQRARETGDPSLYAKAEDVLAAALQRDPQNIEALIGQGTLMLARHDFAAALALGQQARALHPNVPRIYGVIADAQIELGQYPAAVETVQTMVDLRPDLGSYSRVSYLRELHGDLPGAIEAMEAAVAAGGPNAENGQWVRVQLGHLFFSRGDLAGAEQHYQQALNELPGYVPAQVGLARVRAAQGELQSAASLDEDATRRMPLPEYVIAQGDVYAAMGDQAKAQQQYQLVQAMDALQVANGVNTELETALFYADHNLNLAAAVSKARAAYAARPSIHAADVLAWTLYQTGEYAEAQRYAAEALRLGTQDATKLFHAGMIAHARGEIDQARSLLQQAVQLNPHFSLRDVAIARQTLQALGNVGHTP